MQCELCSAASHQTAYLRLPTWQQHLFPLLPLFPLLQLLHVLPVHSVLSQQPLHAIQMSRQKRWGLHQGQEQQKEQQQEQQQQQELQRCHRRQE